MPVDDGLNSDDSRGYLLIAAIAADQTNEYGWRSCEEAESQKQATLYSVVTSHGWKESGEMTASHKKNHIQAVVPTAR